MGWKGSSGSEPALQPRVEQYRSSFWYHSARGQWVTSWHTLNEMRSGLQVFRVQSATTSSSASSRATNPQLHPTRGLSGASRTLQGPKQRQRTAPPLCPWTTGTEWCAADSQSELREGRSFSKADQSGAALRDPMHPFHFADSCGNRRRDYFPINSVLQLCIVLGHLIHHC